MSDKESYFFYAQRIAVNNEGLTSNLVIRYALDYFFKDRWEKRVDKPAVLNLTRDQLKNVVHYMEKMASQEAFLLKLKAKSEFLRKNTTFTTQQKQP